MKARLALVGLLLLTASAPAADLPESGAEIFAHHDFGAVNFGALDTVAVPWKLAAAALVLDDPEGGGVSQAHLKARLQSFGFLWPERIEGADGTVVPGTDHPLGVSVGEVTPGWPPVKVTVANLGCASCHAGPTYAVDGAPLPETAWLGAPNTSLDLEAYTRAVTAALKRRIEAPDELLQAVRTLFPRTSKWEMASLRWAVIPTARRRLADIPDDGSPLPFPNGAPGLTNGVAALKLQAHASLNEVEAGFTSIPDLADRTFRTALLYDGVYAPRGEPRWRPMGREDLTPAHRDRLAAVTSIFTVPSMGNSRANAHRQIEATERVFAWLETRRPQAFPGPVDRASAARGADVYARSCASCHGTYAGPAHQPRLERFPNWHGRVGSDPARASAFTLELTRYAGAGDYGAAIDPQVTGDYAATVLSGLWATAPYMHNGSVPTLAQFMLLEPRSERFLVGGHRLDFRAVGVAGEQAGEVRVYPAGYRPWSRPAIYDTRQPGRSNQGHEAQFEGLTVAERWDLIEYLKGL
ncbi:c-type cytochrome [Brevundimonas lenta]|uniref:Mono/diheme cytochrome c family protein n=1 Tax=Brevundimonas lenta TaxID=424796 RepID=A0A7W6NQC2_9CAUL|nr:c-type cytochrome [Brevundimonas lenta]MBB4083733.1 mono/diheme cytochrome c family protein [Brevundimonas lenta]